jgi:hypothetical protein
MSPTPATLTSPITPAAHSWAAARCGVGIDEIMVEAGADEILDIRAAAAENTGRVPS